MKNDLYTTEEKLRKARGLTLSEREFTDMKSELLAYAAYHTSENKSLSASHDKWYIRWSFTFSPALAALFLMVATGYASTSSLPGEFLYPVKINVVEEMVGSLHFSEEDRLDYELSRFEERLTEIHHLSQSGNITPVVAAEIVRTLDAQFAEFESIIDGDTDESLSNTLILDATNDMIAMTRATEQIIERSTSTSVAEAFSDIADDANKLHHAELREFLETESTEEAGLFLMHQIEEIQRELDENDVQATTSRLVYEYLEDIDEEISNGDIGDAAELVGNALHSLEEEEYVFDFAAEILEEN